MHHFQMGNVKWGKSRGPAFRPTDVTLLQNHVCALHRRERWVHLVSLTGSWQNPPAVGQKFPPEWTHGMISASGIIYKLQF